MVVGEVMIVAGLGSRKRVAEAEVLAAVDAALAAYGLARDRLDRLATAALKKDEPALHAAGAALRLELIVVDDAALRQASGRTLTQSDFSAARAGTPSVSEASALAAAGAGSRLLGPRIAVGPVTCALAVSGEAP